MEVEPAGVKVAVCYPRQRIRVYPNEQATMLKCLPSMQSHKNEPKHI